MSNKLIKILTDLGLSENEARVYFATLSLGSSTVLQIARTGGIKRTTVYAVLESLKQKGLISVEVKGFKQMYVAEEPERLETILNSKREILQNSMPEFSALHNLKGGESFIKYYEGLEASKSVYEDLLKTIKSNEDYMVISDQEKWYSLDPNYFQKFIQKRARLNINTRLLLQDSQLAREHQKYEKNFNEKIKILPEGFKFRTNLIIIPERVVIQQLTPPIITMVIENKSIIEMNREMFEIMWQSVGEKS